MLPINVHIEEKCFKKQISKPNNGPTVLLKLLLLSCKEEQDADYDQGLDEEHEVQETTNTERQANKERSAIENKELHMETKMKALQEGQIRTKQQCEL